MAEFNPTTYDIMAAVITSYDGKDSYDISSNFIGKWSISQSMNEVAWSGTLYIVDTSNLLEGLPLRGEEILDLWIKAYDLDTLVKIRARIHKVSDILPSPTSNSVSYVLHFISETSFNASLRSITAPYRSSINQIAKEIFNSYFAPIDMDGDSLDKIDRSKTLPLAAKVHKIKTTEYDRDFTIQPTVGISKFIIPELSPTEAMYFIASRGYNPSSPSQTFRFFETIEGYYFCTDEYFLKGLRPSYIKPLFYAPNVPLTTDNAQSMIERVEELSVLSKGIDTSNDINSGSYRNEVVELDLIRREFNISTFNFDDATYIDMDGKPRDISSNPHTELFRNETFTQENAKRFMLFKNYQRPGDTPSSLQANKHIPEIVHNRVSYFHHLNNTSLAIGLKGRLDLRPGMIVDLDMKGLVQGGDVAITNTSLSGKYLIQMTSHTGDEQGTLNTALRLVKFDWSVGNKAFESQDIPEDT